MFGEMSKVSFSKVLEKNSSYVMRSFINKTYTSHLFMVRMPLLALGFHGRLVIVLKSLLGFWIEIVSSLWSPNNIS